MPLRLPCRSSSPLTLCNSRFEAIIRSHQGLHLISSQGRTTSSPEAGHYCHVSTQAGAESRGRLLSLHATSSCGCGLEREHTFFLASRRSTDACQKAANLRNLRSQRLHILGLPAEIRNRVFSYVVVQDAAIVVTGDGPREPALLSTCTQIREETLTVYYTLNSFLLIVTDFDALPLMPFWMLWQ